MKEEKVLEELAALRDECLSTEGLMEKDKTEIIINFNRAKINLGAMYRRGFLVEENFNINRRSYIENDDYGQLYSHFEGHIVMMGEIVEDRLYLIGLQGEIK